MRVQDIHSVFMIGVGGIGMSALARYFNTRGVKVSGYDLHETVLTRDLEKEGISITYSDEIKTLNKNVDLVIYTPAIPQTHRQYNFYKEHGYPVKKRAEILGLISNHHFSICIAGAHGKTTTSSLVAHILKTAGEDVGAFLGGLTVNYHTNYLEGDKYVVVEADEYDRSFLHLRPNIALVTSVDTDHLDIYKNFETIQEGFADFLKGVKKDGLIFLNKKVDAKILPPDSIYYTYSLEDTGADFHVTNVRFEDGATHFQLHTPKGIIKKLILNYGGRHNVENAVGASAIALELGVSEKDIKTALATFKGVKRRFQTIYKSDKYVLIDDYAHHPRELDAVIQTTKNLYPGRHLTVVFQPHLYSRTKDLATEFAKSLSVSDKVILLPIYPARELPMEGVTSRLILQDIHSTNKKIVDKNDLVGELDSDPQADLVLMVGAGDINQLLPNIFQWLKSKEI
ncbi:MAG: UDP-N-acetylmuramate--L-alanine ligase [Chitinophagales bacterium]|nr:UDP-N-acetylmuramate--L-alanine ligase [Chitinophagales bacterium]